jgi:hypothetical protein
MSIPAGYAVAPAHNFRSFKTIHRSHTILYWIVQPNPLPRSSRFNGRILLACALCTFAALLGSLSFAGARWDDNNRKKPAAETLATAPPGWSAVPSPNRTVQILYDVKCTSASDCWAVGSYNDSHHFPQTLTEHWNGSSWQIVPSPSTSEIRTNRFFSVSCASATDCWAVGYVFYNPGQHYQTLFEHWNGATWSIVSPAINDYQMQSVKCNSPSDCWAVGTRRVGTGDPSIIEHWDGNSWSIFNTPVASSSYLMSVTCTSASDCWAVGDATQTRAVHWDGSSWTVVNSPNVNPAGTNRFQSVTCLSASQCWAVGYYLDASSIQRTLIERWDGVSWAIVSAPNANAEFNALNDVACASASDCSAVGVYYLDDFVPQILREHWNGVAWSIDSSGTSLAVSSLNGVACTGASQCWAAGTAEPAQIVIEQWNGNSWARVNAPNVDYGGGFDDILGGVTCTSASDCWAVGSIISHWNGAVWSIVHSESIETLQDPSFGDVTCISASDCWAVGSYFNKPYYDALINHWDGNSWSSVNSPSVAGESNVLYDVACTSAANCWAVGEHYTSGGNVSQTLVQHWDGSSWSIVTSPNPDPTRANSLWAVACASASQCWAVGQSGAGSNTLTLIEYWDGTSWSIVNLPNGNPGVHNFLNDVTCVSASDCWAVGGYHTDGFKSLIAITAHWNGTAWSMAPPSDPENYSLSSVTCSSASNCWAVSGTAALIQHWDGNAWSFSTDNHIDIPGALLGVTCLSGTRCWAVGYYMVEGAYFHTFIGQYIAPPPNILSLTRPTNGHFIIAGRTAPNISVTIEASINLVTFTTVGTVTSDAMGFFQFEDLNAGLFQHRFYRASIIP